MQTTWTEPDTEVSGGRIRFIPHGAHGRPGSFDTGAVLEAAGMQSQRERAALLDLFMQTPAAVCILHGAEHRIELLNADYQRILGLGRPVLGKPVRDALPELAGQGIFELLDEVYASGEPQTGQERTATLARGPGGRLETMYFDYVYTPIRGSDGAVEGIFGQLEDVTNRVIAAAALRASEERYRSLVEGSPDSIAFVDLSGTILTANQAAASLFGVTSPGDLVGRSAFDVFFGDDPGAAEGLLRQTLADGNIHDRPSTITLPDGTQRHVEISGAVVRDVEGLPAGFVGITRDVTARRRAEEALRTSEREAERQREVLLRSEKLRALGQLASGVAHDLNQQFALVSGYGELAQMALAQQITRPPEVDEALQIMTRAARDGGETVKRLLTFTRGSVEGPAEPVDLGLLVRDVAQLTAPRWRAAAQAEGRPISLVVEAAAGLWITGWPHALREAITNLIFNAVDALPDGGSLRLRGRRVGGQIQIEVIDNGTGMSEDVQEHLFEPFFTTKGERGTGLGLAGVYGIVERHHGTITVESAVGEGTTFRLSFAASSVSRGGPQMGAAHRPDRRGVRVLAVEDEPALRTMISRILVQAGHSVRLATTGEEALAVLEEHALDVDLVLSDLALGDGMNGWELVAAVRQHWSHLRIVLATGWGGDFTPKHAEERGADAVVAKPYRVAELLDQVRLLTEDD